jgi:hypothetical protein
MTLRIPATPAINKQGRAKVTFLGYEKLDERLDEKTGVVKQGYTKLMFEIMDTTRKSPIKTNIVSGSLSVSFKAVLESLGVSFEEFKAETTEDEEGYSLEGTLDDDGFTIETVDETTVNFIFVRLDALADSVYTAKVSKNAKGYWELSDIKGV